MSVANTTCAGSDKHLGFIMLYDFEIAEHFYELAALIKAVGGSPYRARAFHRAALALDAYGSEIAEAWQHKALRPFRNVGKGVLARLDELLTTGNIRELEELRSTAETHNSLRQGDPPTGQQQTLFDATPPVSRRVPRRPFMQFAHAEAISAEIAACLTADGSVRAVEAVGELRRCTETVSCLEFLVVSSKAARVRNALARSRFVTSVAKARGKPRLDASLRSGCDLTVELCAPEELPALFLFRCGPEQHVQWLVKRAAERRMTLGEHGLKDRRGRLRRLQSDRDIYDLLGLPFIAPPLRAFCTPSATGVIPAPHEVVDPAAIKGDLHVHSEWSDGLDSLDGIVTAAEQLGYHYIAVADHTAHLRVVNGLDIQRAKAQLAQIRETNARNAGRLLSCIEVDILPDGSLDLPPSTLRQFDLVVGAIHTATKGSQAQMLSRLHEALSTGAIDILAHPTGRLLGRPGKPQDVRPPYLQDMDALFNICLANGVALEINCFPERMDLCAEDVACALAAGLRVSIGTDAHSIRHFPLLRHGILTARRAWAHTESVLNALAGDELRSWARQRRASFQHTAKRVSFARPGLHLVPEDQAQSLARLEAIPKHSTQVGSCSVGIDLSGSLKSKTGWAFIAGHHPEVRSVRTDDEIVAATLDVAPAVVSIDSPLALPRGRCCESQACSCAGAGITREGERVLMRMGIGVFPCLLPSMVPLTVRGIRLARSLRQHNLRVIESFPGAAQDLLGIHRKKTSRALLAKGLKAFGLDLDYKALDHDDLDALTSAVVGRYWLAGQHFGVGEESESPIIVPRVPRYREETGRCVAIGLSGATAAGKTTTATYLAFKYGFRYIRYSMLLRDMLLDRGVPCTKHNLQELGLEVHNTVGPAGLTRQLLERMSDDEHWVIDGMRHVGDDETLRDDYGDRYLHIHVCASHKVRGRRFGGSVEDPTPLFQEVDDHPVEQEIPALKDLAETSIENNTTYKALFRHVDALIQELERP